MKVGRLIAIVVAFIGLLSVLSMYFAMSSGDIEKRTEVLAGNITPWWLNPLVVLSASPLGVIFIVLIIVFKDKITNIQV